MAAEAAKGWHAFRKNKLVRDVSWALIGQATLLAAAVILAVIVVRSVA